ncbi:MAG: hypothetical protein ACJ76J_25230, partial [Thermoanaerobaculia bacterium]
ARTGQRRAHRLPRAAGGGRAGDMPGSTRKDPQADRLAAIRLRYCINSHLDTQGLTTPPDIARAVGLPAAEAVWLLNHRQWRAGNMAALRVVADRLGLEVPLEDLDLLGAGEGRVA